MTDGAAPSAGARPQRGGALKLLRRLGLTALALTLAGVAALAGIEHQVRSAGEGRLFATAEALPEDLGGVAIVLGARVFANGQPSDALEDRLLAALELYRRGRVQKILVSGDHGTGRYDEVNTMQRWLREHGVPARAVYLDHAGFRTLDSMFRAAKVFEIKRAVVCTQRFHLCRAVYLGRAAGIDVVGLEADRRVLLRARFNDARERLARVRAWLDVAVLGTQPKFLGPPIPIDGPASATHDHVTRS